MNPTNIRCPHCGNSILVKQSGKVTCPSCGTALYVEEKEKSVQINVNLGGTPKPRETPKALIAFVVVLTSLLCFFMAFLPFLDRLVKKEAPKAAAKYATTLTDPVLVSAFTDVFEKAPAAWTEDDYARVKKIFFQKEHSELLWLDVTFTDDSEKRVPMVHEDHTIEVDGTAFQAFPNLEGLYAPSANTGDDIRISFESKDYANTLGNLKKLRALYLSNNGSYNMRPEHLADLVADPATVEELGGVTLIDEDDVDELCKRFPKLKTLLIGDRGEKISLSALQKLSQLEELGTSLNPDGNEDLLELTGVKKMQLSARASGENVKDLRFLSSLTQLESLTLVGIDEMKSLNVLSPLSNLQELRLYNGGALRSIEPLRSLTGLRVLDIGDCFDIEDLNALTSLTNLTKLRIANTSWHFKGMPPDLSGLTALEELETDDDTFPQIAGCHNLKKLTLFLNDSGESEDFSLLSGLSNLEELCLNLDSTSEKLTNIASVGALPKLQKLTVVSSQGPVDLGAFPHVTDMTLIGESIVADMSSSPLHFAAALEQDNTALERLTVIGFDGVQIGGYGSTVTGSAALSQLSHCTALRELRLNHCGLTDLDFAGGLQNVEVFDISGNRIEDISPLTALPKLRVLYCGENEIQNIAVMQNKGITLVE